MPVGLLLWAALVVVLVAGGALWSEWRYKTKQFVCRTFHASVKTVYPCGKHAIVPLGSIDYEWSHEGGEGTAIVPRASVEVFATYVVSNSAPTPTELKDMPREVQDFIEMKSGCGPPYYYTPTNLRPASIEDIWNTIAGKLEGNPSLTKEEFGAKMVGVEETIKTEMKKIQAQYDADTSGHKAEVETRDAIISTQHGLITDKTRPIAEMADALGSLARALSKKSILEKVGKKKTPEAAME